MIWASIFLGLIVGGVVGYFIYLKERKKEVDKAIKIIKEGKLEMKHPLESYTQLSEAEGTLSKKEEESTPDLSGVEKAEIIPPLPPVIQESKEIINVPKKRKNRTPRRRKIEVSDGR